MPKLAFILVLYKYILHTKLIIPKNSLTLDPLLTIKASETSHAKTG